MSLGHISLSLSLSLSLVSITPSLLSATLILLLLCGGTDQRQRSMPPQTPPFMKGAWKNTLLFSFQSLGVIYGRMSIAPIYVFGTIRPQDITSPDEVYQLFSFLFWTLTIISLLKYATIVLRANDNGEGGPFAIYSLLCRHAKVSLFPSDRTSDDDITQCEEEAPPVIRKESKARRALKRHRGSHFLMLFLALFGACMIIGDGVLTPAISVLSASEGVKRSLTDIAKRCEYLGLKQEFVITFCNWYEDDWNMRH